jgi:hypothetical protein
MKTDTVKKLLLYLVITFVIVSIWQNPSGSAEAASAFLSAVGSFFSTLIDKTATFVQGLFG